MANEEANEPVSNDVQENEATTEEVTVQSQVEDLKSKNLKLEQAMTRQSYELGELRKLKPVVDQYLMKQEESQKVDILDDPDKGVQQRIESNPKIREMETKLQNMERLESVAKLKAQHPDYEKIVDDNNFNDWVQKSKYRSQLLNQAHVHYDFEAADELLTMFKERQSVEKTVAAKTERDIQNKESLSKAKVPTGNATGGKKTYTRLELINMKNSNPELYRSLNVAELYRSGRVR